MASQAYYNGNWYNCVSDTTAGESPASNPEKWVVLEIPSNFERVLVQMALEEILPGEGQNTKRLMERRTSKDILDELMVREEGVANAGRPRTSVTFTR